MNIVATELCRAFVERRVKHVVGYDFRVVGAVKRRQCCLFRHI